MRENRWVLELARNASEQGIEVDIDGEKYDYEDTERISRVLQKKSYMLDVEGDALGQVVALHIDSVGPSQKPSYKSMIFKTKN